MAGIQKNPIWKRLVTLLILAAMIACPGHSAAQERTGFQKIDPSLKYMVTHLFTGYPDFEPDHLRRLFPSVTGVVSGGEQFMLVTDVFIKTHHPERIRPLVCRIGCIAGDVVTAEIFLASVERLARHPDVQYIAPAAHCRSLLDVSIPELGVDAIWNGELGSSYKGEDVIIGIVDSGIDWSHPGFISEDQETRILFLWDQLDTLGSTPTELGFTYGTEYNEDNINNELNGTAPGTVFSMDTQGHGTHTAGIAGGNGNSPEQSGTEYRGVSPESDFIIVKAGDDQFLSTNILDGVAYIAQRAELNYPDRPLVINLSIGQTQLGSHDGSSLFEQGLDNLIWEYDNIRSVVTAAGNEGNQAIHFKEFLTGGESRDSVTVDFSVSGNRSNTEDVVQWDIWYEPVMDLSVLLITPAGGRIGPVNMNTFNSWKTIEGDLFIDNASGGIYEFNGCNEVFIRLSDSRSGGGILEDNLSAGTWKLRLFGHSGRIDGWLYESSLSAFIESAADQSTLVAEPGNAYLPISVGSYISRIEWPNLLDEAWGQVGLTVGDHSSFSSPGPTRPLPTQPARQKPEISAPGEMIVSALSSMADPPDDLFITPDSIHRAWSGTSMAAPHVTGVIALMLSANPMLTVSEIRGVLQQSAKTDMWTGDVWNSTWGYGKLNAFDAVDLVTSVEGAVGERPEEWHLFQNHPNPFNAVTEILLRVPNTISAGSMICIRIHDIRGRLVRTLSPDTNMDPGMVKLTWDGKDEQGSHVSAGLYIYRLDTGAVAYSRKMLYIQ